MPTKQIVLLALAAALLFGGLGYLTGRKHSAGETVKTAERVEQTTKAAETTKKATVEQKDEHKDVAKNVEKTKTTTKRPDGTVVIEERTKDLTTSATKSAEARVERVEVEKRVEVVKVETREKVIIRSLRPEWLIGVNAGVSLPALAGRSMPSYLPGVPAAAVIGVSAERHLFWNVYGGAFANSQGVIGVSGRGGF